MLEHIIKILKFWFHEPMNSQGQNTLWQASYTELDTQIKDLFEHIHYSAVKGRLNAWLQQPKSCLAFIILVHQFPRRMYREQPIAFQFDGLAIAAAEQGREHKLDKDLSIVERVFFYAPYLDSEMLSHQRLALMLYQQLLDEAKELKSADIELVTAYNKIAQENFSIIQNFKRFPQRNEILERESTQEELLYLNLPNNRF